MITRKGLSLSLGRIAAISGLAVGAMAIAQSPASAGTTRPCYDNEFCLWYNSDFQGSWFGWPNSVTSYQPYEFDASPYGDNGNGFIVKNNAASAANYNDTKDFRVYFNSNYGGTYDVVCNNLGRNLVNTKNDNASGKWTGNDVACV